MVPGWRRLAQELLWTIIVVLAAEGVEVALQGRTRGADWFDRLAVEGAMHALVRVVLLWQVRVDPLMRDAEVHPVDIQE